MLAKQSEIIYYVFSVYQTDLETRDTGQNGSIATELYREGAASGESVTTAEIGSTGEYSASFTPTNVGKYILRIDLTGTAEDSRIIRVAWEVEANDLDDLKTEIDANETKIDTIDTVVDAIQTVTDNLPNSGALTDIDTGVNNIEAKLPTNYIMGSSDQTDKDDEIDTIDTATAAIQAVTDLLPNAGALTDIDTGVNNIEAKLPTNYIMGSSDVNDHDTDIDAILVDTAAMQPLIDQSLSTTESNIITEIDANEAKIDIIDTVVDAIRAVTDLLPNAGALTDIDSEIGSILADTAVIDSRLPTVPADQSLVEAAITALLVAIKGADADTLKTLSDQIDVILTVAVPQIIPD